MSPDQPLVIDWSAGSGAGARPPRDQIGVLHPFQGDSVYTMEKALGDGTSVLACAQLIVIDQQKNAVIPMGSEASDTDGPASVFHAHACGPDHHIHVYVGVHDASTMTSHIVHDFTTDILC